MATNELIIGRRALFKHCDMGVVEVVIKEKVPELDGVYQAELIEVKLEKVRLHQMALNAMTMLRQGREVPIMVESQKFICYVESYNLY